MRAGVCGVWVGVERWLVCITLAILWKNLPVDFLVVVRKVSRSSNYVWWRFALSGCVNTKQKCIFHCIGECCNPISNKKHPESADRRHTYFE